MPGPTQHTVQREPFDRRGVQGRRIVERRDGEDLRLETDRRVTIITMNILDRRIGTTRRSIAERRFTDLRIVPRRDISDRRH